MTDSLKLAAQKALEARDEAFDAWYMQQSKMPYRSPQEIAGMGWHAAMDYVHGLLLAATQKEEGDGSRDAAGVPAGEWGGLSAKQAWWAGYRVGKGLPADMPRSEAVAAEPGYESEDAARYRWLRGGSCIRQGEVVLNRGSRVIDKNQHTALVAFHFWCGPEELDAAIDAAILEAGRASIEGEP